MFSMTGLFKSPDEGQLLESALLHLAYVQIQRNEVVVVERIVILVTVQVDEVHFKVFQKLEVLVPAQVKFLDLDFIFLEEDIRLNIRSVDLNLILVNEDVELRTPVHWIYLGV